jgi:hypothetical protein
MAKRREAAVAGRNAREHEMRDQEVRRANRELAAYFKGRRTEREARAALKIIKAFVRERERRDPGSRPPLPGTARRRAARAGQAPKSHESSEP